MAFRSVSLAAVLTLTTCAASEAKPLLRYTTQGDKVVDWTPLVERGHRIDKATRFGGAPSLAVERDKANRAALPYGCRWISRPVQVVSGQLYTVCAQVRTAGVSGGAVGFQVNFYRSPERAAAGAFTATAAFEKLVRTSVDWTFAAHTFRVPEGVEHAVVWLKADREFEGQAWFNQVHLVAGQGVPVPVTDTPPKVDGDLSDPAWKQALQCYGYYALGEPVTEVSTVMRVLFTKDAFYLAARCTEPNPDRMLRNAVANDDPNIWRDDSVELFVAAEPTSSDYHQFIFNTLGKHTDWYRKNLKYNARGVTSRVRVAGDRWTLEARIPLTNFVTGFVPGQDEEARRWRIGLCRNRYAGKVYHMHWGPRRQYHRPHNFVPIHAEAEPIALSVNLDYWTRAEAVDRKKNKVAFVDKPLFRELLTDEPRRFRKHTGFVWRHPFQASLETFALKYGLPYDREAFMKRYRDVGMGAYEVWWGSLDNAGYPTKPEVQQAVDRTGIPIYYYARFHGAIADPRVKHVPTVPRDSSHFGLVAGKRIIFDPDVLALAIEDLERTVRSNPKRLVGVSVGDEVFMIQDRLVQAMWELWHRKQITYPFLDREAERIRTEFGYGKYGPPEGHADKNPFRWIAMYKWFNEGCVRVTKRFGDTIRKLNPALIVASADDSLRYAYGVSRIAPHVDVWTGQLGHRHASADAFTYMFNTKRAHDTSGKPVWPAAHFENMHASHTANEIVALWSGVIASGGEGIQSWPSDHRGTRVRGLGQNIFTQYDYYGHPPRTDATLYVCKQLLSLPKVKFPKPEAAILQSNITAFSQPKWTGTETGDVMEGLYTLLGPRCGTWFEFVEDFQLLDGKKDLARYQAVFMPAAKFGTAKVVRQITDYVRDGGTLVIADPETFTFLDDGSDATGFLKTVAGVTLAGENAKALAGLSIRLTEQAGALGLRRGDLLTMASPVNAFAIKTAEGVQTLARYQNGGAAVTLHRFGKGRCFYFAFNPGALEVTKKQPWIELFRTLCKQMGLTTGRDIWRFQLPLLPEEKREVPKLTCLTGNHFQWWLNVTHEEQNAATAGMQYRYSRGPDRIPDAGGENGWIPFSKGDLTDRRTALRSVKQRIKEGDDRDWVVGFGPGPAMNITLDFGQGLTVDEFALVYTGVLPRVDVEASDDGRGWKRVGRFDARTVTTVDRHRVPLSSHKCRYLKLSFAPRQGELTLSEIEVWGQGAKLEGELADPAATGPRPEGHLIRNPGFEKVAKLDFRALHREITSRQWNLEGKLFPEGWALNWRAQKQAFITIVDGGAHTGRYCVKVWPAPGRTKKLPSLYSEKVPVGKPPVDVEVSVWARGKGRIGLTLYTYGLQRGQVKSIPFSGRKQFPLTGEWKKYTATLRVANDSIQHVRLALEHTPGKQGGECFYDDASLRMSGW